MFGRQVCRAGWGRQQGRSDGVYLKVDVIMG